MAIILLEALVLIIFLGMQLWYPICFAYFLL